jgi:hypothetical protein
MPNYLELQGSHRGDEQRNQTRSIKSITPLNL